ncbi:hypothetical protein BDZ91DRAFT_823102 [Kalaharituber pfeilii]|nr:hypothetical protein BDZ91DRAFT_823102 [Kalaharituber pfeilii]
MMPEPRKFRYWCLKSNGIEKVKVEAMESEGIDIDDLRITIIGQEKLSSTARQHYIRQQPVAATCGTANRDNIHWRLRELTRLAMKPWSININRLSKEDEELLNLGAIVQYCICQNGAIRQLSPDSEGITDPVDLLKTALQYIRPDLLSDDVVKNAPEPQEVAFQTELYAFYEIYSLLE